MIYDFDFGSSTAKGGFASENRIVKKFNNWKKDKEAQKWLKQLGYNYNKIKKLIAIRIPPKISKNFAEKYKLGNIKNIQFKKADLQVQITITLNNITLKRENISVKKANKGANYNQVDKRKIDTYKKIWDINEEITEILKLFTGELNPILNSDLLFKYCYINSIEELEDKRRIFLNYLKPKYLDKLIYFFKKKKKIIIKDIIKGRGELAAEWLMVVKHIPQQNKTTWALLNRNQALDIFSKGEVKLTKEKKASLQLSDGIILQRKGGTPDPTSLQFKIKPLIIFDYIK